jgi:hypothetical protein
VSNVTDEKSRLNSNTSIALCRDTTILSFAEAIVLVEMRLPRLVCLARAERQPHFIVLATSGR